MRPLSNRSDNNRSQRGHYKEATTRFPLAPQQQATIAFSAKHCHLGSTFIADLRAMWSELDKQFAFLPRTLSDMRRALSPCWFCRIAVDKVD